MTAATLTEAAVIDSARTVLDSARRGLPDGCWPPAVDKAYRELADTIECYDDIRRGALHPAAEFPELEHDPEPLDAALRMAARDAGEWAGALTEAIAAHTGGAS